MTLKAKSIKDLSIIFFLGISSGLPLALVVSTLKILLLERGFDIKTIGFFSLVSIPYSIKFLYAPIIDSCKVPLLTNLIGQRRSWIITTQIGLIILISCLGVSGVFANILTISIFALLVALFSASQDIVIDGYRIELIKKEDQGLAAGCAVYGYRIGMLLSGAGALALAEIMRWDAVYFIMSLIIAAAIIATLLARETRENFQVSHKDFSSWFNNSVINPLRDFIKRPAWLFIIFFIITFKLADAFAGNLTLPFLVEVGFSKIEIASIAKTFGLFATLFGILIGGILVKKIGVLKSLWIAAIMQALSNLSFCYLAKIGYDINLLYLVIFIENFSGGIGDAVFVAYLSGLCNVVFSATQYALLSSLATVARTILVSPAGIFVQDYGWYNFFIISTIMAIPSLFFLIYIQKVTKKTS